MPKRLALTSTTSPWLTQFYQVVLPETDAPLTEPFDLGILDGLALDRLWEAVEARKKAEEPVFIPIILLTSRRGVDLATRHLWRTIDEVVLQPIEKVELHARVETLLRLRQLSLTLKLRNQELEAFTHAMTHELRAPLRVTAGYAQELLAAQASTLGAEGCSFLTRIVSTMEQTQDLVASLLGLCRIGRNAVRRQRVYLNRLLTSCLRALHRDIQTREAKVVVRGAQVMVEADPALLKLALTNLLANALNFVSPGVRPYVTISSSLAQGLCRIVLEDNGIGIAQEDQARLFTPFVRLHGVEEYPGLGLGLATVEKAMDLMGGRVGVTSAAGLYEDGESRIE